MIFFLYYLSLPFSLHHWHFLFFLFSQIYAVIIIFGFPSTRLHVMSKSLETKMDMLPKIKALRNMVFWDTWVRNTTVQKGITSLYCSWDRWIDGLWVLKHNSTRRQIVSICLDQVVTSFLFHYKPDTNVLIS